LTTAPAGPVIKVLVRGSNAPLHVTGWYGDTVFVDLPEAAPAAPAPEPLTDEQIDQVIGNSACWDGPGLGARFKKEAFARLVEQAHGIAASKKENL
jgi:hypothetical protein